MILSHSLGFPLTMTPWRSSPRKLTPVPLLCKDRFLVFSLVCNLKSPRTVCVSAIDSGSEEIEEEEEEDKEEERNLIEELPKGLERDLMPKHVAVIMDGNGRWAKQRKLPPWSGHAAGAHALNKLVKRCCTLGIRVLTVFAFSTQNWNRSKMEIDFIMSLLQRHIKEELDNYMKLGIQASFIGDTSKLPKSFQKLIVDSEEATKNNEKLQLVFAVSYSGQYDIMQACQSIAQKAKNGLIEPQDIDEVLISQQLQTNCTELPYPDLLIRSSGELRLSNFLLWQLAYTELFFAKSLWPDFGEAELLEALHSFQQRQRRYGRRENP